MQLCIYPNVAQLETQILCQCASRDYIQVFTQASIHIIACNGEFNQTLIQPIVVLVVVAVVVVFAVVAESYSRLIRIIVNVIVSL